MLIERVAVDPTRCELHSVTLLFSRAQEPLSNEDDWGKLTRLLKCFSFRVTPTRLSRSDLGFGSQLHIYIKIIIINMFSTSISILLLTICEKCKYFYAMYVVCI